MIDYRHWGNIAVVYT